MHTFLSLDMSSLTFEQWIMFPMSFPHQFLWWNCQALASAPSKQTAASCNLHKVLFSFLWDAFPWPSPYNPFLIRIDNFYCDFSSSVLSCIVANFLQGPISPCNSEIAGTSPSAAWAEHEHVLYRIFLKLGTSWTLLLPVCGCSVCAGLQTNDCKNKSPVGDARHSSNGINNSQQSSDWVYWKWSSLCILKALLLWGRVIPPWKAQEQSHWRCNPPGAVWDTEVWVTGLGSSSREHRINPTALKMDQLEDPGSCP